MSWLFAVWLRVSNGAHMSTSMSLTAARLTFWNLCFRGFCFGAGTTNILSIPISLRWNAIFIFIFVYSYLNCCVLLFVDKQFAPNWCTWAYICAVTAFSIGRRSQRLNHNNVFVICLLLWAFDIYYYVARWWRLLYIRKKYNFANRSVPHTVDRNMIIVCQSDHLGRNRITCHVCAAWRKTDARLRHDKNNSATTTKRTTNNDQQRALDAIYGTSGFRCRRTNARELFAHISPWIRNSGDGNIRRREAIVEKSADMCIHGSITHSRQCSEAWMP